MGRTDRRGWRLAGIVAACAIAAGSSIGTAADSDAEVEVLRLGRGEIKPRAEVDADGAVHVVYYRGALEQGDLFYRILAPGAAELSAPVQVNSQPAAAAGNGLATSHQIALGGDGRVHVAFPGSPRARPKDPSGKPGIFYTRSAPERDAFEPERNVRQRTSGGPHGGQAVAADRTGAVWVAWYGFDGVRDEARGKLFVARSTDGGRTFGAETAVSEEPLGACHCCSIAARADAERRLHLLYRSAGGGRHRDMHLFTSDDGGETFSDLVLDRWELAACPASGAALADSPGAVLASFESSGRRLGLTRLAPGSDAPAGPTFVDAIGRLAPKMPVVAANSRGEVLLAWLEGVSGVRGGRARWQLYDAQGRATDRSGTVDEVQPNSLVAVVAMPDGSFLVIV